MCLALCWWLIMISNLWSRIQRLTDWLFEEHFEVIAGVLFLLATVMMLLDLMFRGA